MVAGNAGKRYGCKNIGRYGMCGNVVGRQVCENYKRRHGKTSLSGSEEWQQLCCLAW